MNGNSSFSRRRLMQGGFGLAAAGFGLTGLSGCSSGGSGGTPKGFTEVTFSSIGTSTEQQMYQDMIAAAQEETLNDQKIKVKWTPTAGDDWASIMLQFSSGTASDIQRIDDDRVYDLATSNKILQLDKMMLDPNIGFDLSKYVDSFASKVAVEGYQFSITPAMSANAVYYNKKLFQEAGLTAPTSWAETWGWDEFEEAARALTKKNGAKTDVYGMWYELNTLQATCYGAGDKVINDDQTECGYSKPETEEYIDKQINFIREGITPTVDVDFLPLWNAGKLAMLWNKMSLPSLTNGDIEWDLMPWPKTPIGAYTKNYARTWVIPNSTKEPEAAYLGLKALCGKAAQEVIAKAQWAVPALTEVAEGPAFTGHDLPATPNVWAETLGSVDGHPIDCPLPRGPIGTVLQAAFFGSPVANGLMSGKTPTHEYITQARDQVNDEIKKRNWSASKGLELLQQGGGLTDPDSKVLNS